MSGTPHGNKFVNDAIRNRERLGSEWMLVPLAIAGGILVAFGLKWVRQPAARFLLPGPIAYDVAQAVTPQLREQPSPVTQREPRQLKRGDANDS
jgi:hypothetical protein